MTGVGLVVLGGLGVGTVASPGPAAAATPTGASCFNVLTSTLTYSSTAWIVTIELTATDSSRLIQANKFKAEWIKTEGKVPATGPHVLHEKIQYLPPLNIHFFFDIENRWLVPTEAEEAEQIKFWEDVAEKLDDYFKTRPMKPSQIHFYCNCSSSGQVSGDSFASPGYAPGEVFNRYYEALKCLNADPEGGISKKVTIPTKKEARFWVVFRQQAFDQFYLDKTDLTKAEVGEWSRQINSDYADIIHSLNTQGEHDRLLIVLLGSQAKDNILDWNELEGKIEQEPKSRPVMLLYLQVKPDPNDDYVAEFIQQFTSLVVRVPISVPWLFDHEQAQLTRLRLTHDGCLPVEIPLWQGSGEATTVAPPAWAHYGLQIVQAIVVLLIPFGLFMWGGLLAYQKNWLGFRAKLNEKWDFPWQE